LFAHLKEFSKAAETSTKHKKSRSDKRMSGDKAAPSKGEQAKTRIISVAETLGNAWKPLVSRIRPGFLTGVERTKRFS
jgi:hypothetical protein